MTQSLFGIRYFVASERFGQQRIIGSSMLQREGAIFEANQRFAGNLDPATDYVVIQDAPGYHQIVIHSARKSLNEYNALPSS